jgi:hypothetical protein
MVCSEPTPFWYDAFVEYAAQLLPKHLIGVYTG